MIIDKINSENCESSVHWSLIKDGTTKCETKIDPDDISVEVLARKRVISEIDKTEELYKCDICNFSTKHEQNLRIHKKWFK